MKIRALALSVLVVVAGIAPASAAFLGTNSPLGENFLNTRCLRVSADVSRELHPVSGGSWLEGAAEFFVAPGSNILENAANGRAFEQQGLNYLQGVQNNVADQVSVRPFTESGELANFRVRLDALGTDNAGSINWYDFKSSAGTGFTPNQQAGYPLLEQFGGQVVGNNGGLAYPAGRIIPPTPVQILRPGSF